MFYYSPEAVRSRRLQRSVQPQRSDLTHRTELKNCQSCRFLPDCTHVKKSHDFLCNKYEVMTYLLDADYVNIVAYGDDKLNREQRIEFEKEQLGSIELLIEQAISDQSSGIETDFVLEDQDIPLAENFLDFYTNPQFKCDIVPFPKQIGIAAELFTEVCLNPKCTDIEFLNKMPKNASIEEIKSKITFLKHGVCKCGLTRLDMWNDYGARRANTVALAVGQRAGKDQTLAFLGAYQDHRYLKLRNPAKVLNLASGNALFQTFTGIDFSQAKKATFIPYKHIIEKSEWYKMYHQMLDNVAYKQGKKLYSIGEDSISWNYHGLVTLVSSPDVRALRGVARRSWSITEYAYFYSKTKAAVRLDAEGILEALQNSTAGVISGYDKCIEEGRFDTPQPLTLLASSPRSIRDPIMTMLKIAEEDTSVVARHMSSFDFNPNLKESSLRAFKIRNPQKYKTSILAIPADATSAFITDKRLFINCIDKERKNAISGRNKETISPTKVRLTSGSIKIDKNADKGSPKVLSLDASQNQNSFAMAVMHIEEDEGGTFTVVDGLYEIIPSKNKPCDYPDIYDNIIVPICESLNVQMIMTDRYPAGKQLLQQVDRDLEIPGLIRSAKYPDFVTFKQSLFNGSISFPAMEVTADDCKQLAVNNYPFSFERKPVAHTMIQSITVEDLMGKKVDKGEGFTDDLFYALVNGYAACNDPDMMENFLGDGSEEVIQDELVAVSRGYDGQSSDISIRGGQNQGNDLIAVYRGYRDR